MTIKSLFYFIALFVSITYSNNLAAQQSCACLNSLDTVVSKIDENYIGYALTKDKIETNYKQHISKYRAKATETREENCAALLQSFLQFFKDGHLFAVEYPNPTVEEKQQVMDKIKANIVEVRTAQDYLIRNKTNLSAIEGIWTSADSTKFAVVKNINKFWPYEYVAVTISAKQTDKIGEIKFGVSFTNGKYAGLYYSNAYVPRYVEITPAKENSLLHIWGGIIWGKIEYTGEGNIETLTAYNPMLPSVRKLNDETIILTIPTFLVEKKDFDKVLFSHYDELVNAKYLIIDIRGNAGGNGIYFDLLGLYAEKSLESEIGLALSSPDNIAYFKKFAGSGNKDPYAPVVADMKNSIGKIVEGPRFSTMKINTIDAKVQKVAILTDKANISAAETFILSSKQISSKVITIGTNTGGVVDYNNINMIKIGCESRGLQLGYPTFTFHKRIPEGGYNNVGIKPDFESHLKSNELINFAIELLKK